MRDFTENLCVPFLLAMNATQFDDVSIVEDI